MSTHTETARWDPPTGSVIGLYSVSSKESGHLSASAIRAIRQSARAGDPVAQFALGNIYGEGEDIPQEDMQAFKWLRKSAEQGDARAQSNLGLMYDNGRGVARDYEAAIRWYRKAADPGDSTAQTLLEGSLPDACHADEQCALVYAAAMQRLTKVISTNLTRRHVASRRNTTPMPPLDA